MSEEKYKNISCHLYDELEGFASLKQRVIITYLFDGEEKTFIGYIADLKTEESKEFLITNEGGVIRLDKLIKVVVYK